MVRRTIVLALSTLIALLLVACSSGGGDLTGKTWQLTAITGKTPAFQGVVPAPDQSKYTIAFASDGTYTGTADCNQIAGTYKTSGSNLTITPGPSTLAFCGEGSMDALYTHALSQASSYAIANGELTITQTDGGTLTFAEAKGAASPAASAAASASAKASPSPSPKASAKPPASPGASAQPSGGLVGKAWQLVAVTEQVPAFQGAVPADQQANYTIEFTADLTFSAKADCNTVSGTYETADPAAASGSLAITLGPSTLVACPEGSLSDLYVLGLSNAASYQVANAELMITLVDGGTLQFK